MTETKIVDNEELNTNKSTTESSKEEVILDEEIEIATAESSDEPEELAVAADIEPQETAADESKNRTNTRNTQRRSSETTTVTGQNSTVTVRNNNVIGDYTEDISRDIDTRSREQIENDEWTDIRKHVRSHGIYWGIVRGVQDQPKYNSFSVITTVYGHIVKIAEESFLTLDMLDKDRYFKDQKPSVQKDMRRRRLEAYIGAQIPFTIIVANRQRVEDDGSIRGYYYKYLIGGSRVAAMEILQDYWFFHEKRRFAKTKVEPVREGMVFDNVKVLTAHEHGITVELCGVETYIERFELITTKYMESAGDEYHPGDLISVILTKIRINTEPGLPRVVLRASVRRLLEDNGRSVFEDIAIGGLYRGTVSRISSSGNYVILLDLGVTCVVSPSEVEGRVPLDIGNTVLVRIRVKYPDTNVVAGRVLFLK